MNSPYVFMLSTTFGFSELTHKPLQEEKQSYKMTLFFIFPLKSFPGFKKKTL